MGLLDPLMSQISSLERVPVAFSVCILAQQKGLDPSFVSWDIQLARVAREDFLSPRSHYCQSFSRALPSMDSCRNSWLYVVGILSTEVSLWPSERLLRYVSDTIETLDSGGYQRGWDSGKGEAQKPGTALAFTTKTHLNPQSQAFFLDVSLPCCGDNLESICQAWLFRFKQLIQLRTRCGTQGTQQHLGSITSDPNPQWALIQSDSCFAFPFGFSFSFTLGLTICPGAPDSDSWLSLKDFALDLFYEISFTCTSSSIQKKKKKKELPWQTKCYPLKGLLTRLALG